MRKRIFSSKSGKGAGHVARSLFVSLGVAGALAACALVAIRPVQEMSDTQASIRAAREVQADTLAPELFRNATEWFFKARQEYKLKNFKLANDYAVRARFFAEQAEFEAIRNGGNRTDVTPADPIRTAPAADPRKADEYPTPTGTPIESYAPPPVADAPPPPLPTPEAVAPPPPPRY